MFPSTQTTQMCTRKLKKKNSNIYIVQFLYLRKLLKLCFSRLLHSPTWKQSVTEPILVTHRNY